jgi:hypothetical protein
MSSGELNSVAIAAGFLNIPEPIIEPALQQIAVINPSRLISCTLSVVSFFIFTYS